MRVQKGDFGNSMYDQAFSYKFTISGVSPQVGSKNGGQLVTITGTNFLNEAGANNVFVYFSTPSEDINVLCTVVSYSATQLVFIAPPFDARFTGPVTIVVQARLQEENLCIGNCTYSYGDSVTGSVTAPAVAVYNTSSTYALSGSLFSAGPVTIYFGTLATNVSATVANDTSLTFTVPDMPAQQLTVLVFVSNLGYAGAFAATINFQVFSVYPSGGSVLGNVVNITGSGFSASNLFYLGGVPCTALSVSGQLVTADCAASSALPASAQLVVYQDAFRLNSSAAVFSQGYTSALANTPNVTSLTPNASAAVTTSNLTLTLTALGLNTYSAYLLAPSSGARYAGAVTGLTVAFTNVPAGVYRLVVRDSYYGYAAFTVANTYNFTLQALTVPTASSSLAGGQVLTISGGLFDA